MGGVPITGDGGKNGLVFPMFSKGFTRYRDTTRLWRVPLFERASLRFGDQQFPPLQDWLSLVVCHRVHIEVAGQVVEPFNVVFLARTTMRIAEALLEVEGWDGRLYSDTCTSATRARVCASRGITYSIWSAPVSWGSK
jgi:hypothetical protein